MTQKPVHLFWGVVSLLLGTFLAFATARTIYATVRNLIVCGWSVMTPQWAWFLATSVPISILAIYLVRVARNQFQRATGQEVTKSKVRWGPLITGIWIVFFALKSHFVPGPHARKADNAGQAAGMFLATIFLVVVGITLMCLGYKSKPAKKEMPAESATLQMP